MIGQIIQMLIILLIGNTNGPVHDLRKQPTHEDHMKALNSWIQKYSWILLGLFFIAIFLLFAWVCFTFVGTGVESGNYYNHFNKVV